jgi:hypothetical protein
MAHVGAQPHRRTIGKVKSFPQHLPWLDVEAGMTVIDIHHHGNRDAFAPPTRVVERSFSISNGVRGVMPEGLPEEIDSTSTPFVLAGARRSKESMVEIANQMH